MTSAYPLVMITYESVPCGTEPYQALFLPNRRININYPRPLVEFESYTFTGILMTFYIVRHHFFDPLFPFAVLRGLSFHNTS
jgi:hypothetical protein